MDITCVTVDCRDPGRVADFWNEALHWGGVAAAPDGSGAVCGPAGGGAYLEFIRVPEDKAVKNRVHLGARSRGRTSTARSSACSALGASIAWEEEFPPEVAGALPQRRAARPRGQRVLPRRGRPSVLNGPSRRRWPSAPRAMA